MEAINLHAIRARYLGPTNYRGSRVKLTSERFKDSVTLDRNYEGQAYDQAEKWLIEQGFDLVGVCELKDGDYLFLSTTFLYLKEHECYVCGKKENCRNTYWIGETEKPEHCHDDCFKEYQKDTRGSGYSVKVS